MTEASAAKPTASNASGHANIWPALYATAPTRLPNRYAAIDRSGARNTAQNHVQLPRVTWIPHRAATKIAAASARTQRTAQAKSGSRNIFMTFHGYLSP